MKIHNRPRLSAIALAGLLLTGCAGGDESEPTPEEVTTSAPSPTPTTPPAPESDEPTVSNDAQAELTRTWYTLTLEEKQQTCRMWRDDRQGTIDAWTESTDEVSAADVEAFHDLWCANLRLDG